MFRINETVQVVNYGQLVSIEKTRGKEILINMLKKRHPIIYEDDNEIRFDGMPSVKGKTGKIKKIITGATGIKYRLSSIPNLYFSEEQLKKL